MRRFSCIVFFLLATLFPPPVWSASILGVAWEGAVVSIDASNGSFSVLGNSGFKGLNSLASNSLSEFYTVAGNPLDTAESTLVRVDPVTGAGTALGSLSGLPAGSVRALAFSSSDTLYAIINGGGPFSISAPDDLYIIDVATRTSSLVGNTGFTGIQGLDFSPNGTLYGWDLGEDGKGLVTINPATGLAVDVNPLVGEADADIQSVGAASEGTLYGARSALFTIDPITGVPTLIGSGGYPDLRGIEVLGTLPPTPQGGGGSGSDGVVPEPVSFALFGLGFCILLGLLRRREGLRKSA